MEKNVELDLIKDRTDIVELVREYVPGLKKAGKNYKGRCPFHEEKTPSFHVDRQKGLFYCFGCQEGGDIFDFLMKTEHLSFTEAAAKLASRAGVVWKLGNTESGQDKTRIEIKKALLFAGNFYHKTLLSSSGEQARKYLKSRNIGKTTAQKFSLGFAPDKYDSFYKAAVKAGFKDDILIKAGLIIKKDNMVFDYFRGRLMFPILNTAAEVVGFGGRVLSGGEPKYLNTAETPVFHKSRVLFGLSAAAPFIRKQNHAFLLEGYTDVIACSKFAINNTVAPLGTAVGFDHARILKRYCQEVTVVFDADRAGINAAVKGAQILTEGGLYVKVANLGDNLDPDAYLNRHGADKMLKLINSAPDLAQYHTGILLERKKMPLSASEKSTAANELAYTISKQTDEIIRKEWIKQISQMLDIDYVSLGSRVQKVKHNIDAGYDDNKTKQDDATVINEVNLLAALLKFPEYVNLCNDLTPQDFQNEKSAMLFGEMKNITKKNTDAKNLTEKLLEKFPGEKKFITRLSIDYISENFKPEVDIVSRIRLIKRKSISKQLMELKNRKKELISRGEDVGELQKQEIQLTMMLKSSNAL